MAETQYVLSQTKQGKKEWIPLPTGGVAAHNQAWSTITDTPTTLLGYGITDGGSMEWPGAGIPLSTGVSPWGTSYTTSGSGTVIPLQTAPTFLTSIAITAAANKLGSFGLRGADWAFKLSDSAGNMDSVLLRQSATDHIYIGDIDDNGADVILRASGADAITILASGRTGIGTSAPAYKLDVSEDRAAQWAAKIYNSNATGNGLVIQTNNVVATEAILGCVSNGTYKLFLSNNGKLGIGTTSPAELLHVAGNGIITGSLMVYSS